jgi:hypothetical protein
LPAGSPVTPNGRLQKDIFGNVWIEVTAEENGKAVTGWIEAEKTSASPKPVPPTP